MNAMLLLRATMPPPPIHVSESQWLCVNTVVPARVTVVLSTTSAVPRLSWKEQLTSSVCCVDCKRRA